MLSINNSFANRLKITYLNPKQEFKLLSNTFTINNIGKYDMFIEGEINNCSNSILGSIFVVGVGSGLFV